MTNKESAAALPESSSRNASGTLYSSPRRTEMLDSSRSPKRTFLICSWFIAYLIRFQFESSCRMNASILPLLCPRLRIALRVRFYFVRACGECAHVTKKTMSTVISSSRFSSKARLTTPIIRMVFTRDRVMRSPYLTGILKKQMVVYPAHPLCTTITPSSLAGIKRRWTIDIACLG